MAAHVPLLATRCIANWACVDTAAALPQKAIGRKTRWQSSARSNCSFTQHARTVLRSDCCSQFVKTVDHLVGQRAFFTRRLEPVWTPTELEIIAVKTRREGVSGI